MGRVLRTFKWGVVEGLVRSEKHEALKKVEPLKKGRCTAPESKDRGAVDTDDIDAVERYSQGLELRVWSAMALLIDSLKPCGLGIR